jgi:hypothetical protein
VNTLVVSCGIFRAELAALAPRLPGLHPVFLDSMLHMRPQTLQEHIDRLLAERAADTTLFIYGDCTPRIVELCRRPGFAKTPGRNCCEILLGREDYRRLRKSGAFFFLPEWTLRWREVFERELGFAQLRGAGEMLREIHSGFIYLDTGVMPVPRAVLRDIERNLGLPVEVLAVGLDRLERRVLAAREALHG